MSWNYRKPKISQVFTKRRFLHVIKYGEKVFDDILGKKSSSYRTYKKRKKSGGFREIFVPDKALKRLQQQVHGRVLQEINFPSFIHCGPKGKSVVSALRGHERYTYHQTLDVKGFFDSVTGNTLLKALRRAGFNPAVSGLICAVAVEQNKLAQGFPTSPLLSSLVLSLALRDFYKVFGSRGVLLSAYADDLMISSDDKQAIEEAKEYVQLGIANFGLSLNSKGGLSKNGEDFTWLGLRVFPRAVVPKKKLQRLERALYKLKFYGDPLQQGQILRGELSHAKSATRNRLIKKADSHLKKKTGK
jgi:hypothetical protein